MKKASLGVLCAVWCACCFVSDPTGTRLNVRDEPNGTIIDTVRNHEIVGFLGEEKKDNQGRLWALIDYAVKEDREVKGWVFRKYINCDGDKPSHLKGKQ